MVFADATIAVEEATSHGIYVLSCPRTKLVRYVGRAKSPRDRHWTHIAINKAPSTPVQVWVQAIRQAYGVRPIFKLAVSVAAFDVFGEMLVGSIAARGHGKAIEKMVIRQVISSGYPLLNVAHNPTDKDTLLRWAVTDFGSITS